MHKAVFFVICFREAERERENERPNGFTYYSKGLINTKIFRSIHFRLMHSLVVCFVLFSARNRFEWKFVFVFSHCPIVFLMSLPPVCVCVCFSIRRIIWALWIRSTSAYIRLRLQVIHFHRGFRMRTTSWAKMPSVHTWKSTKVIDFALRLCDVNRIAQVWISQQESNESE